MCIYIGLSALLTLATTETPAQTHSLSNNSSFNETKFQNWNDIRLLSEVKYIEKEDGETESSSFKIDCNVEEEQGDQPLKMKIPTEFSFPRAISPRSASRQVLSNRELIVDDPPPIGTVFNDQLNEADLTMNNEIERTRNNRILRHFLTADSNIDSNQRTEESKVPYSLSAISNTPSSVPLLERDLILHVRKTMPSAVLR